MFLNWKKNNLKLNLLFKNNNFINFYFLISRLKNKFINEKKININKTLKILFNH